MILENISSFLIYNITNEIVRSYQGLFIRYLNQGSERIRQRGEIKAHPSKSKVIKSTPYVNEYSLVCQNQLKLSYPINPTNARRSSFLSLGTSVIYSPLSPSWVLLLQLD